MNQNVRLENGKLVMTKEIGEINEKDGIDVDQVKLELRAELNGIIRQVKSLKSRAEEIQDILKQLDLT